MTNSEKLGDSPEQKREKFDRLAQGLEKYGAAVTSEKREVGAYRISFQSGEAVTTVRIVLGDYSGSGLVITNMTTLPDREKGKGFGSKAIETIKEWAKENNLGEVRATQVSDPDAQRFWMKNGFVREGGENKTSDYIFQAK
ncbi:MAG: GNAT family N-acetyltransferase [Candidatus Pacebacteria bacterium]|nr:GNAT family N-acetyltransferase [Candidatus Paceibacterota bacterium]